MVKKSPHLALIKGIRFLSKSSPSQLMKLALPGQPFDSHLLALSPLYRKSRQLYLAGNGTFVPALVSSPRTLSSSSLLENRIEYSPIEQELIWAATDPRERRNPQHLFTLRTFSSSLFHEQSHRILWQLLPGPPKTPGGLRRYLNLVESLVIVLDMALGDELGPKLAPIFYLCGVTYDPGTDIKKAIHTKREYRNYLQAAMYATYLNLELYTGREISRILRALFPTLGKIGERAAQRSCNLDREFVQKTNPVWQKRHRKLVMETLSRSEMEPLDLTDHPLDNRLQYLWTEKWFDIMGL